MLTISRIKDLRKYLLFFFCQSYNIKGNGLLQDARALCFNLMQCVTQGQDPQNIVIWGRKSVLLRGWLLRIWEQGWKL